MKSVCCKLFSACLLIFYSVAPSLADYINLDPDNYDTGSKIPSNAGAYMRYYGSTINSIIDTNGYFTDYYARNNFLTHYTYSVEPIAASGMEASTFDKVYGYTSASGSSNYDGATMHVLFGSYDSTQGSLGRFVYEPTNFASIDVLWPAYYGGQPAGYVDMKVFGVNNTLLSTYRYYNSGTGSFSDMSVFDSAIYRISVTPGGPSYSYDNYGLDNLYFMDPSVDGNTFNLSESPNINAANGMILTNDDILTGIGSIVGDISSSGLVSPGNSPGTIVVDGDYEQLPDGVLEIELGGLLQGSEYDWLDVSGSAVLAGTLSVSFYDLGSGLFSPSAGDSFDILSAYSISSEFDILDLPSLGNQLEWLLEYLHYTDSDDFVRLSVVASAGGDPVPEPATLLLFGTGLAGLAGSRMRRKKK